MSFQSNTTLVALELSNSVWLVGTRFAGAQKSRMHRITAGDTAALLTLLTGFDHPNHHPNMLRRSPVALRQGGTDSGFIDC